MNSERGSLSAAAASAMESRVWRREVRTWFNMRVAQWRSGAVEQWSRKATDAAMWSLYRGAGGPVCAHNDVGVRGGDQDLRRVETA